MPSTTVSFILMADPPCNSSSWRPTADTSMWWSRRDSLCRISALSLYFSQSLPSTVCENTILVFNSDSSSDVSVMAMTNEIAISAQCPTEFHLVSLWKKAALAAEKQATKCSLLSFEQSTVCSFTPYIESTAYKPLDAHSAAKSQPEGLDKRTLLKQLQAQCSLDFLRKWKLNGPEDLILKKISRSGIESAMGAWKNSSKASSLYANSDSTSTRLEQTFEVILRRIILSQRHSSKQTPPASVSSTRITILVLHEDNPTELPIYGRGGESFDDGPEHHHVVCILGAVRDATSTEIDACLNAAAFINKHLDEASGESPSLIRRAACNLGRTAEFTSKICATICIHTLVGRLGNAVSTISSPVHEHGNAPILRLAPERAGGWTWDGQSNKTVGSVVSLPKRTRPIYDIEFVLWIPFNDIAELRNVIGLSTCSESWTGSPPGRENCHGMIQAIVCALWRSRVGSENASFDSDCANIHASITPKITLVFADDSILTLTQATVLDLSQNHQAAPTERQVLAALAKHIEIGSSAGDNCTITIWEKLLGVESGSVNSGTDGGIPAAPVRIIDLLGIAHAHPSLNGSTRSSLLSAPMEVETLSRHIYELDDGSSAGEEEEAGTRLVFLMRPEGGATTLDDKAIRLALLLPSSNLSDPDSSFEDVLVSPGLAVTVILQWVYSNVLSRGINKALAASRRRAKIARKQLRKRPASSGEIDESSEKHDLENKMMKKKLKKEMKKSSVSNDHD